MTTIPAHDMVGNGVTILLFRDIDRIIAFSNGAGNGAAHPAVEII